MSAPLYEALLRYENRSVSRFHMPGHGGKKEAIRQLEGLLSLDVTELPDTGSLFDGLGPTRLAEEAAARCFGTKGSFLSAGGSTLCVEAMLALTCPKGSTVIMDRCIHHSALNAVTLLGLHPVWIWRTPDAGPCLPGRIRAEDVELALRAHPDAAAVYVTSPDYYGVLCDIPAIADTAHRHRVPLLVDGAHGSHLGHVRECLAPWRLGADYTACSAHKTLPALTGAAWLHVQGESALMEVHEAMALFGSTSPSYLILLSLDLCRDWLEETGGAALCALEEKVSRLKQELSFLGYGVPKGLVDPLRLTLFTGSYGIDGVRAAEYLRGQGVEPEFADYAHLVTIPCAFHTEGDFDRLRRALQTMPNPGWTARKDSLLVRPSAAAAPGEVFGLPAEMMPTAQAKGRISAGVHMPCPPAVPILMPGERIDEAVVEMLINYEISNIKVVK